MGLGEHSTAQGLVERTLPTFETILGLSGESSQEKTEQTRPQVKERLALVPTLPLKEL